MKVDVNISTVKKRQVPDLSNI